MRFVCIDGPMDGATYTLDKKNQCTNRKPDGLWFDAQDEHGRWVQHQYKDAGIGQRPSDETFDGVTQYYKYDGPVVDTGIEFATEPEIKKS